mmetsp:Transcript_8465/g.14215  ORF Transcript_8465/g.14215 Transcript_8465/m.14215 type:complete len:111 (-) Transcript_8465:597-929(-)
MNTDLLQIQLDFDRQRDYMAHDEAAFNDQALKIFEEWVETFKRALRPIWVDPLVNNCFICEREFSFIDRQHHCRKCGTAVCSHCSNHRLPLHELGYYDPVRVCKNCKENF